MEIFTRWIIIILGVNIIATTLLLILQQYPYTFERKQWHHVISLLFNIAALVWLLSIKGCI